MRRNQTQIDVKSIRRAARERELFRKRNGVEQHSHSWGGVPDTKQDRHKWRQMAKKEIY